MAESSNSSTCVVASERPWNQPMQKHLEARTSYRFELIKDPEKLNHQYLKSLDPRYIFFPHWSHRIAPEVFTSFECVIFHMTDLPFGRGGSPLQNLISRGINETKISALKCEEGLDSGPIYLKYPLSLHGRAEEIYLRAAAIIEDMICEILESNPVPVAQQGEVTVFNRRTEEQSNMAEAATLEEAYDLIRMLDAEGYPHAFLDVGQLRLEFTGATRKAGQLYAEVRISQSKPK